MKKTVLIIFILLMTWSAVAQDQEVLQPQKKRIQKFYIGIGLGGGISTASSFDMVYKYSGDVGNETVTVVPVGLGSSFNGSLAFGYWFNKYIAVELAVTEFLGLPTKGDSVVHLIGASKATVKVRGGMLSVIPSIVISAGLKKINPYARFGFQIGVLPNLVAKYSQDNSTTNPPENKQIYNDYYGGVALGYTAAGGVNFTLTNVVTFYIELQFSHATWSPSHSQIVKYTVNGEDRLSELTTWQKEADFVWEKNVNGIIDQTQPRQELRKTVPFSTASINLGIKFRL
ncbi:MAG: outer membrane beta-barrel protein [Bacteroidetes bacterium]|nr:outer membrane beta-barrel protein [Bacteroidota bacterium]